MLAVSFVWLWRAGRAFSAVASMIMLTGIASEPATAATTATASFTVTAAVVPACTLSATNLGFGNYTGAQVDSTSTLTVNCSSNTSYSIGLGLGTYGGTVANRNIACCGSVFNYVLYSDQPRTVLWGVSGSDLVTGVGIASAQTLTVYGRLPANQLVNLGSYSDTLVATMTF